MAAPTHDELCRRIVDETPDAVIYADRDGAIHLWNAAAATMFGYTTGEALGQSLDLIIPENLRGRHWEGYHRVMATGESRYAAGEMLAVPGVRKDGSRLSLEFTIAPLRDDAGTLIGIAATLRDVTERWQQDRDLRKRLAALEAQVRAAGTPAADSGG